MTRSIRCPVAGEVACGVGEEPGRGDALLVGEDFGVADAGVVIDRDVDVVVSDSAAFDLLRAAVGPPAAAVRDTPELLHVQMDQFPGPWPARTGWPWSGPRGSGTGQRIAVRQPRDPVRVQDPETRSGPGRR